jgi:hypothetical protein
MLKEEIIRLMEIIDLALEADSLTIETVTEKELKMIGDFFA